ncbi:hypothetical protein Cni_G04805 [Canna indica]|uniref:DUF7792 domain-containing protein n=1 Tax=Canna indica TaxID=4628 RepID=A0AAQ3Q4U5_9LILI|nr:hypothetical protein Cni_G04805 [Canna indica]
MLLCQAAHTDLYERPVRRIMDDTEQVLGKALALMDKCRNRSFVHRLFSIISTAAFAKISTQIDNSISDVSCLLYRQEHYHVVIDYLVNAGVYSAFAKVLKDGLMMVQAMVAVVDHDV